MPRRRSWGTSRSTAAADRVRAGQRDVPGDESRRGLVEHALRRPVGQAPDHAAGRIVRR